MAATRLDKIVVKTGLALGLMNDADRETTLAFAAIHFAPGIGYAEKTVTVPEFQSVCPDDGACIRYLESMRWPTGFTSPKHGVTH